MSVVEVHPEELLDRELRGELSESDRVMLSAHLARCSACRMERQLRLDFERELGEKPAAVDLGSFVSGALGALGEAPEAQLRVGGAEPHVAQFAVGNAAPAARGRRPLRRLAWLVAASLLLSAGVGVAAAQLGLVERARQIWLGRVQSAPRARVPRALSRSTTGAGEEPVVGARAASVPAPRKPAVASSASSPKLSESSSAPASQKLQAGSGSAAVNHRASSTAPHERSAVRSVSRPAARARKVPLTDTASRSARAPSAALSRPMPAPIFSSEAPRAAEAAHDAGGVAAPQEELETASRAFERANHARHLGHLGEAVQLYHELERRFPESPEALLSVAVVARIDLDRGKAQTALSGFESYLASRDAALREEALAGRIRALSKLGRTREARARAGEFIEGYPRSPFVAEARALLQER